MEINILPNTNNVDIQETPVFYADSEEEAKAMVIAYMVSKQEEKPLARPTISFLQILYGLICPVILHALNIVVYFFALKYYWSVTSIAIIIFVVFVKPALILFVLLYQRFASEDLRKSCRFEPSCSEYMLLAIKKYGFIKGLFKGINRLIRCHYPNGGKDYP